MRSAWVGAWSSSAGEVHEALVQKLHQLAIDAGGDHLRHEQPPERRGEQTPEIGSVAVVIGLQVDAVGGDVVGQGGGGQQEQDHQLQGDAWQGGRTNCATERPSP